MLNANHSSSCVGLSGFIFFPVGLVVTKYYNQHFMNPKGLGIDEFVASIN